MKNLRASKLILSGVLVLLASAVFCREGACDVGQGAGPESQFALQLVSGPLFSQVLEKEKKDISYIQTNLRFCWPLDPETTAEKIGLGGYFDLMFELTDSSVFEGPGNYLTGATFLIRYNFLKGYPFLAPYIQVGAGIVYNDVYKDESQSLVGEALEFTPQAAIGLHYFLNQKWSLDGELMFHHISNANLAKRNMGVDSVGGLVGVSFLY